MQYLFNQALTTPGFDRAPALVAENPVLAPALPFMQEVHAAWNDLAPEVRGARAEDDWPEALFERHAGRFAVLEREFFTVNHAISQRLSADIVVRPHDYFAIETPPGVPEKGLAHVTLRGSCHLRFEDGFPVGPNILERKRGGCDVVWFSRDRTLMTSEAGYGGARSRAWIHYPTQRSGEWTVTEDRRQRTKPTLAFWTDHGLQETFGPDGRLESASDQPP